jgi:hypothetical protein
VAPAESNFSFERSIQQMSPSPRSPRILRRALRRGSMIAPLALALAGCHLLSPAASLPARNTLMLGQLVVYTDFELPKQHRLLAELTALRADLSAKLELPLSDEPIHVYLFETQEQFRKFMQRHYPDFPSRRAFFVETDTQLAVYAYWGDRVAEDLRHETAHGYLHSIVPDLPLWLDEGLAEYFEVSRGHQGVNRPHVEDLAVRFKQGGFRPDLARLERIQSIGDMTHEDYAECWAWVHLMLHSTKERRDVLIKYLAQLRQRVPPTPISVTIRETGPRVHEALVQHVLDLEKEQN